MAAAVPLVMTGISAYSAYKSNQKSKEEKAGLAGQNALAGAIAQRGGQTFNAGFPATTAALSYYDTLLRGDRAKQQAAVAGPIAQMTDNYRGAERGLEHAGVRGGVRDLGMAELQRDKTNSIAGLTLGQQPAAAGALSNLGSSLTAQGTGSSATASGIYGNLAGAGFQNRQYANQNWQQAGQGIGSSIFDIYRQQSGKKAGGQTAGVGSGGGDFGGET